MAHHKRRRPKKRRAGWLYCKPYKGNGVGSRARTPQSALRQTQDDIAELV
jgi:hypothetical protein